ncbi:MAG: hypothetical protein FJ091_04220 [Deltaproteobacteria bacterium]|nr:hypothetical protein [Deltaproteobacteria bacterium]
MSVEERLSKQMKSKLGARAVYLPGTAFDLGDVLRPKGDGFQQMTKLARLGVGFDPEPFQDMSLDFVSSGTKERIFQAGAELPSSAALDLAADASVRYEFGGEFEYVLKTPVLQGAHIENLAEVLEAVQRLPKFNFKEWRIVTEVYVASEFAFVASEKKKSSFEISGKASGIVGFLTAGASLGLKSTRSGSVSILGKGGPVAMSLTKVPKP